MQTYILIDLSNTFFRARHAFNSSSDVKIGMALHIVFQSIKKAWQDFGGSHLVFALEGRSWRKTFYPPYKANRKEKRSAMSPKEAAEEELFWEAYAMLVDFLANQTNATMLQHPELEADDLIAGFIQYHPNDNHIIISTDSDFHQLIAPNVKQYNGVSDMLTTIDGVFDKKNKPVIDKKTQQPMSIDPEWALFEKCMRGDTSDNVFSAYPGVRLKGSKNKVGLLEAYADRHTKGYTWNNLMLQRFVHHDGTEHRVMDDYQRNVTLIDLSAQPPEIKEKINNAIKEIIEIPKNITQVGIRMMKFCQRHDLQKITDNIQQYATAFQARYPQ